MYSFISFPFKDFLIEKAELQRRGRGIVHLTSQMKPGPGLCCAGVRGHEHPLVSSMDAGTQGLGPSTTAFLVYKQGARSEVKQVGDKPAPIWDDSDTCRELDSCTPAQPIHKSFL